MRLVLRRRWVRFCQHIAFERPEFENAVLVIIGANCIVMMLDKPCAAPRRSSSSSGSLPANQLSWLCELALQQPSLQIASLDQCQGAAHVEE